MHMYIPVAGLPGACCDHRSPGECEVHAALGRLLLPEIRRNSPFKQLPYVEAVRCEAALP